MSNPTQLEREKLMFGESMGDMIKMKPEFVSNLMYASMILSDAQEVMERGDTETSRQFINKAKFFISEEIKKTAKPGTFFTNFEVRKL